MKKALLLSAVAMMAITAMAQSLVDYATYASAPKHSNVQSVVAQRSLKAADMQRTLLTAQATNKTLTSARSLKQRAPRRRSAGNGLYYSCPQGTMFSSFSFEGAGYYHVHNIVPPFNGDVTYVNHSTNPAETTWYFAGTDFSEYADEEYNMPFGMDPGVSYPPLTLVRGDQHYTLAEENNQYFKSYAEQMGGFPSLVSSFTEPTYMSYLNDHTPHTYAFGAMDSKYLYGSGNFVFSDGSIPCQGVMQLMEAPISPLYVQDFYAQIITTNKEFGPLAPGAKVTAAVVNAETGEPIAVMEADKDDLKFLYDNENAASPIPYYAVYYLKFSQETPSPFGGTFQEPFVIDSPVAIQIIGLAQEGVDFGFIAGKNGETSDQDGNAIIDEDPIYDTEAIIVNPSTGQLMPFNYYGFYNEEDEDDPRNYYCGQSISLSFNAFFDAIDIPVKQVNSETGEERIVNEICITDEGDACYMKCDPEMSFAMAYTAAPWYDEESGNANYYFVLPDWITDAYTDDSAWEQYYGLNGILFAASPLPEGVEGRGAYVFIDGRGIRSNDYILVYQGDYEVAKAQAQANYEAGIHGVTVTPQPITGVTYNLQGQRVAEKVKGIVLRNGKKYLNK